MTFSNFRILEKWVINPYCVFLYRSMFEAVEDNYEHIKKMATVNLGSVINELEVNHTEGYSQAMAKLISWNDMQPGKKKYKLVSCVIVILLM